MVRWAYGVTTTLFRRDDLLPRTLASLAAAGFDQPWLFVDGSEDVKGWRTRFPNLTDMTFRAPKLNVFGNWVLALAELYIRNPSFDRFALFQDDLITYQNLRDYLDRCSYPERGYWNLFLFNSNYVICPRTAEGKLWRGWYRSNQFGRGAVALVFNREAVQTLLTSEHFVGRPTHVGKGWKAVDGGVVTSMQKAGWTEYVHYPSLTFHTGKVSSIGNLPHRQTPGWAGDHFDLRTLSGVTFTN